MIQTGTYERNLDAKGRLSLPAALRRDLSDRVYVVPALDVDALYVFSAEDYEKWVMGLFELRGGFNPRSREDQQLMRKLNATATAIEIDSASRISLPEILRTRKGLNREVTVVGNFDHLEVWDRNKWEDANAELNDDDLADLFFS